MKVFNVVANALFPNRCISCGEIIEREEFLCEYCYEMIELVDIAKICVGCGLYKKDCQCKNRVHHYAGAVAPFENDGVAQQAMYRFKFKKVANGSKFFANEMAKIIKTLYSDIAFDGIVYVPMHPIKQLNRGFNQSEMLARHLAKILKVKLYDRVLSVKRFRKTQHNLPIKERFQNVKGLYSFNYEVTGKTILLVDDIKTTGATLDECAKQLLLAGADNVYCVCGLITKSRKDKD